MITTEFDTELFETIVEENSFNDIEFSKGRQIFYNVEKIFKQTVQLLHLNKAMIIESDEMEFLYMNIDSLSNVYDDII